MGTSKNPNNKPIQPLKDLLPSRIMAKKMSVLVLARLMMRLPFRRWRRIGNDPVGGHINRQDTLHVESFKHEKKRHKVTSSPFQTGYVSIADLGAAAADDRKGVGSFPPVKSQHKLDHGPGGGEGMSGHDKSPKGFPLHGDRGRMCGRNKVYACFQTSLGSLGFDPLGIAVGIAVAVFFIAIESESIESGMSVAETRGQKKGAGGAGHRPPEEMECGGGPAPQFQKVSNFNAKL